MNVEHCVILSLCLSSQSLGPSWEAVHTMQIIELSSQQAMTIHSPHMYVHTKPANFASRSAQVSSPSKTKFWGQNVRLRQRCSPNVMLVSHCRMQHETGLQMREVFTASKNLLKSLKTWSTSISSGNNRSLGKKQIQGLASSLSLPHRCCTSRIAAYQHHYRRNSTHPGRGSSAV